MTFARTVIALLVALVPMARADDLPTPDAMVLGRLLLPADALAGFLDGIAQDATDRVMGARISASRAPAVRTRCRQAMQPALDEAFPPELLAGLMAQTLSRFLSPQDMRALRAWHESPLAPKVAIGAKPGGAELTAAEKAELDRTGAAASAARLQADAPAILGGFIDGLERRLTEVRPTLAPKLTSVAEAVLLTEAGEK